VDRPPTTDRTGALCEHQKVTAPTSVPHVEFWYDPMCPYAYQTSVWLRRVREVVPMTIDWRFFSLEEINREEGKKHPWERPLAFGWSPMRVGAWLRRHDTDLGDRWYEACGHALHRDARRFYDRTIALELLESIGAPLDAWDAALADETTHDDVRADHEYAVRELGGFGVPIIRIDGSRALFGPVVVPAPEGDDALRLWEAVMIYLTVPGLYEIKTPKTTDDLRTIGTLFEPYLTARQWNSVQNPAP
jgi:2-hydroxychromene-2-carboxylate isomerase